MWVLGKYGPNYSCEDILFFNMRDRDNSESILRVIKTNQIEEIGIYSHMRDILTNEKDMPTIIKAFRNNTSIRTITWELNLSLNAVLEFASVLKINTSIRDLNLSKTNIMDEGAIAIAKALMVNRSVKRIILRSNYIGDVGAKAIAEALKVNSSVQEIDLFRNIIGDEGAVAIADALKVNMSIRKISVIWTIVTVKGIRALQSAVKMNPYITTKQNREAAHVFVGLKKYKKTCARITMDIAQAIRLCKINKTIAI